MKEEYPQHILNKTSHEIERELLGSWQAAAPSNPSTSESLTMESLQAAVEALGPRPPTMEIWVNSVAPLQDSEGKDIFMLEVDRREAAKGLLSALPMLAPFMEKPIYPEIVILMHPSRYFPIAALIPDNIPVRFAGGIEALEDEEE